jgi:hypothetical protein
MLFLTLLVASLSRSSGSKFHTRGVGQCGVVIIGKSQKRSIAWLKELPRVECVSFKELLELVPLFVGHLTPLVGLLLKPSGLASSQQILQLKG